METISVHASRDYEVRIGSGLLTRTGELSAPLIKGRHAMIVSDSNVWPLYGSMVQASLEDAGFQVDHFIFPAGEQSKNTDTLVQLLTCLAQKGMTRSDGVFALGGGVTGDMAGLAASLYLRGIPCVQLPTSLLSVVDSSVGGKTAVDLDHGKNQAGCFHQPAMVLCDPALLSTLPEREYRCGCAEIIKTAMLFDAGFFRELRQTPVRGQLEHVLSVCVAAKRDVVQSDEFDRGQRALLNFGHTVGHAVEACRDFTISHGEGVAIGMAVVTRAAVNRGICPPETLTALLDLLEQYKLPTEATESLADILHAAEADKKRTDDAIRLIVPKAVGCCRAETVPAVELADWLRDGGLK